MFDSASDALTWYYTTAHEPSGGALSRVIQVSDGAGSGGEIPPTCQGKGDYDKAVVLASEIARAIELARWSVMDTMVMTWRYQCGETFEAIGGNMGISEGSARGRHARAIMAVGIELSIRRVIR